MLLDSGWSCEKVAAVLFLDDDTVRKWHGLFVEDGLEGLTRFDAASALPDFACAVACYPTGMFESWGGEGPAPFDRLARLRCPVIGFFGNEDHNPSPPDADKIDAELARLGIEHAFYRYPGAGHGFQRPTKDEPAIRAAQADSWRRIFAFLAEKLASPARAASA